MFVVRIFKGISLIGISILLLSGCWDNVEPENREFAISMGIDKYFMGQEYLTLESDSDYRYTISVEFPELEALANKSSEGNTKTVKASSGQTVSSSIQTIDTYSSKKLYLGHLKVAVLGMEVLEDEMLFKEAVDALQRSREISRKLLILASPTKAIDLLEMDSAGDSMTGLYLSNYYKKNNDVLNAAFKQDLDSLAGDLASHGNVLIPKIEQAGENIKISGAAVIKDYTLTGWLDDMDLRGYFLLKGEGEGSVISVEYQDAPVPVSINKNKSKVSFFEENGRLVCSADIDIQGYISEFRYSEDSPLSNEVIHKISGLLKQKVEKEVIDTFLVFQQEFKTDGFKLSDRLRKFYYDLYLKYGENWQENFENLEFRVNADIEIKNAGSLK